MNEFMQSFIETVYWVNDDLVGHDFAPETLAGIKAHCDSFLFRVTPFIGGKIQDAAHDFYLTGAGHGAGFWDGDWEHYGDHLTKIAEGYSTWEFYIGDDGLIYL